MASTAYPASGALRTGARRRLPTRRWLDLASTVALLLAVSATLALAVGPHLFGYRTLTVLSGSMSPDVPRGAVVAVVRQPAGQLRPGQVLTFHAPIAGHPVTTHRVIEVRHDNGAVLVRTKGDANPTPDPWVARINDDDVWVVRMVVPRIGGVLHVLTSPIGHATSEWVLPGVVLPWLLGGLWLTPRDRRRAGTHRA